MRARTHIRTHACTHAHKRIACCGNSHWDNHLLKEEKKWYLQMSSWKETNIFGSVYHFHLLKPSQLFFQLSPRFDLSKSHLHHQIIIENINIIIFILIIVIIIIIVTLLMICLTGMLSNKDLYLCDITEKENKSGKQKNGQICCLLFVMTHVICCCRVWSSLSYLRIWLHAIFILYCMKD